MEWIRTEQLCKTYGSGENAVHALNDVNITIERGEFVAICGASGSGKSTLLNLLGAIDRPSSGRVIIDGTDITRKTEEQLAAFRRRRIGFVFQFYNLVQNLTALENVELAAEICRDSLDAATTLDEVGLGDRMDNFPAQLSGGEQQRVSIARALAKNPKIILCDEPTGALDYHTGKAVLKLLQDTCRSTGKTVLIITHNSALTAIADHVIRVKNGTVVESSRNELPTPVERIEW